MAKKSAGRKKAARRKKAAGRQKAGPRVKHTVAQIRDELWAAFEGASQGKRPSQQAKTWARRRYARRVKQISDEGTWDYWRESTLACARNAGRRATARAGSARQIRRSDLESAAKKVEGEIAKWRKRADRRGVVILGGIC